MLLIQIYRVLMNIIIYYNDVEYEYLSTSENDQCQKYYERMFWIKFSR